MNFLIYLILMVPIAMILAAGIGSRLMPLTEKIPKALLPFRGKPMLDHVVFHLKEHGVRELVINVHHHADQIVQYVRSQNDYGLQIIFSDEREKLMDTGGGIVKARPFLESKGPFLVHNTDIFSSIDLTALYHYHLESGALATLAVKNRKTTRNLLVNEVGRLCGWRNNQDGQIILAGSKNISKSSDEQGLNYEYQLKEIQEMHYRPVAFSGIQVIDPNIFQHLENQNPFSMIRAYLELAVNHKIIVFDHTPDLWIDMAHRDHFL